MKAIDGDLKKLQDDMSETRNVYNQVAKKEGNSFINKDLGDIIYNSKVNAELFVEKLGSQWLSTVIAIVNKYGCNHLISLERMCLSSCRPTRL